MTPEAGFSLLRFHREDGTEYSAWDTVSLSDISSYVTETATGFQKSYVGTENMKKNCAGVCFDDSENQVKGVAYKRGDSLVSNIRPYLKKAWYADRDGVCSNDVLCFRANDSVDTRYLYAFIAREAFFRFMMQAAKGLKMPRGDKEYTLAMPVYLPCMEEQKKIADFLSTVDAKIAAQKDKLKSLEEAKKGLMQQIFSQQVKFRRDDGTEYPEWEEKKISSLCSVSTGKSNTQDKEDDGAFPFYVRSPIIERSSNYLYDEEAVITVGDGVGTGKVFHYVNGKYNLHQRCYRMFDFVGINGYFFFYLFSFAFYKRVKSMSAKTSVDSVRMSMITDMKVSVPCLEEQQKVADFLSTFDTKIAAVQKKIEAWETIKKGLMQRLFV